MSGPEHLPPDDHELEDFLAGRGPHRARYRAASPEQAPATLDAAVLAQARAAVAVAPSASVLRGPSRWRLPLSLAATLVLGLGLVSRVQREALVPPSAPQAPAAAVDAFTAADAPAPAAKQEQQVLASAAPIAEVGRLESAPKEALAKAPVAENRALAVAEQDRRDSSGSLRQAESQPLKAEAAAPVVAAAEPPPPPAKSAPALPAAAAPSVAGMAMADAAAPAAPPAAAMAAPAPRVELQAKRRASVTAFAAQPASRVGRYHAESGAELELLAEARFTLSIPSEEGLTTRLSGRRLQESRRERLWPDTEGALPCALWLESEPETTEMLQLRSDCENRFAGIYRRELVKP